MMKMILFHARVYLSKRTILVFVSVFLLLGICCFINAYSVDTSQSYEENKIIYLLDSLFYIKMILVFLSVFLFCYGLTEKIDFISYLLLTSHISRTKYLFSKIIFQCFFLFIFVWMFFLCYGIFGKIFIPGFHLSVVDWKSYLSMWFIISIYGLYGLWCMVCLRTFFVSILPLSFFLLTSSWMDEGHLSVGQNIILFFFPNFQTQWMSSYYGGLQLIFLLVGIIVINLLTYSKKDLNY